MTSLRDRAWALFDAIVAGAPLRDVNPWARHAGAAAYEPDYDTLEKLLGVPVLLKATSQSGVPALALDVWVAYEFRRAGFERDRVWPRESAPRVLPTEVVEFIGRLPQSDQKRLNDRIATRGIGGVGTARMTPTMPWR